MIVEERTKQLEECKEDLAKHLEKAVEMEEKIKGMTEESLFREHVRVCWDEGVGDAEATKTVCAAEFQSPSLSGGPGRQGLDHSP